jgi:hypothetical protein
MNGHITLGSMTHASGGYCSAAGSTTETHRRRVWIKLGCHRTVVSAGAGGDFVVVWWCVVCGGTSGGGGGGGESREPEQPEAGSRKAKARARGATSRRLFTPLAIKKPCCLLPVAFGLLHAPIWLSAQTTAIWRGNAGFLRSRAPQGD